MTALLPTCSGCGYPISGDALVDGNEAWHRHCRQHDIEARAAKTADRLIARNLPLAHVIADLQDRPRRARAAREAAAQ